MHNVSLILNSRDNDQYQIKSIFIYHAASFLFFLSLLLLTFLIFYYHCHYWRSTTTDLYTYSVSYNREYCKKNWIRADRVRNSSHYIARILLYSLLSFLLQLHRHFSRFDFYARRASISKVNARISTFLPLQSSFIRQKAGIAGIYVCIPPDFSCVPTVFQYSRNITMPRIVAPLPYFLHANAYMRNHRVRIRRDFTEHHVADLRMTGKVDSLIISFVSFFFFCFFL